MAAKEDNLSAARLAVCDGEIYSTAEKAKVAFVDTGVLLSTSLAAKAADSVVIKKTGQQTITQAGTIAVLTLQNMTSDRAALSCVGGDGTISLSGGNVLTCDRPGSMYIRSTDGTSNVSIQSRGSTKVMCDDQVRLKVAVQAESDFTCAANVLFSNLPTSDPGVAGRLYDASGFVKISQG